MGCMGPFKTKDFLLMVHSALSFMVKEVFLKLGSYGPVVSTQTDTFCPLQGLTVGSRQLASF